jgi:hypothetical protein
LSATKTKKCGQNNFVHPTQWLKVDENDTRFWVVGVGITLMIDSLVKQSMS